MQNLLEFAKSLGAPRIAAMGAVALALVGFFAFIILRVTTPDMAPLYTNLSLDDSAAIAKQLDREGVKYQVSGEGNIILVPRDRIARLRMEMAESGLPNGGGVGYEIFDKSDALGTTSFVQNIDALRALEGELERTIRTLDGVEDARVHLVIPQRALFSRETVEPSASIMLRLRGSLDPSQVRAIRHLVATAVSGLKPDRISIVDQAGDLLADGAAGPNSDIGADEQQIAFENRERQQIETIVDSVVGPGHARVEVSADFNYNRVTQTSDQYDPNGRVVRSSQSREETSTTTNGNAAEVTVANQIPQGVQQQTQAQPPAPTPTDQTKKSEETVNYEISKTTRTEVIQGGRLSRVSVAVLVDGSYAKNAQGQVVYKPRSKEEIDQIAALVRSAIGYDAKRGDQVEVINLPFAAPPAMPAAAPAGWLSMLQFSKQDIMQAIEMLVMGLLGLAVLLMVVRPLVRRILTPDTGAVPALPPGTAPAVPPPAEIAAVADIGPTFVAEPSATSKMIDIAQIQGQVHAQSVQKVGEIADRNPSETVSIIRQWLHESAA